MDTNLERGLDDVIDALRHSRDVRKGGCSLLIGAGCSVTAGIETAAGFVKVIEERFKAKYDRAAQKMSAGRPSYSQCMAELSPGQRRDLITQQVSGARINWAHMAIAQLLKNRYVDYVLTTNFDPLILRACAMVGEFPAVYDSAVSPEFRPGELPERAVFHLHGQSQGFDLFNTEDELRSHFPKLNPLFCEAARARTWIVVGYSGDNDPVFDHLAAVDSFPFELFWVGFDDKEPPAHVHERLLVPGKQAFLLRGYDADGFFVELAQKLECFPPEFVQRPFSFLLDNLTSLTEYRLKSGGARSSAEFSAPAQTNLSSSLISPSLADRSEPEGIDILHHSRGLIRQAISYFEDNEPLNLPPPGELSNLAATALFMAGKHEELQHLAESLGDAISPATRDLIAYSFIEQGNLLADQASQVKTGPDADALFDAAGKKYAAALEIKPDKEEALNKWGGILHNQAKVKNNTQSIKYLKLAYEKYERSYKINPGNYITLYNWGNALTYEAKNAPLNKFNTLFDLACDKYKEALNIKPGFDKALYDWGTALLNKALRDFDNSVAILPDAIAKLEEAIAINPEMTEALVNLGFALKYSILWTDSELEQLKLLHMAEQKFSQAVKLEPRNYAALFNWGNALHCLSGTKTGIESQILEHQAEEKYLAAEHIKKGAASHVLASYAARRGDAEACRKWLNSAKEYNGLLTRQLLDSDDFASVREEPWFRDFLRHL